MRSKTNIKRIDKVNWRALMLLKSTDTDSNIECVYFKSKYNFHEASFYAWKDTGYKLQVEDFGFFEKGVWHQVEPTVHQIESMEDAIAKELERLRDIEFEEMLENQRNLEDREDINGHRESVNFNFYKTF